MYLSENDFKKHFHRPPKGGKNDVGGTAKMPRSDAPSANKSFADKRDCFGLSPHEQKIHNAYAKKNQERFRAKKRKESEAKKAKELEEDIARFNDHAAIINLWKVTRGDGKTHLYKIYAVQKAKTHKYTNIKTPDGDRYVYAEYISDDGEHFEECNNITTPRDPDLRSSLLGTNYAAYPLRLTLTGLKQAISAKATTIKPIRSEKQHKELNFVPTATMEMHRKEGWVQSDFEKKRLGSATWGARAHKVGLPLGWEAAVDKNGYATGIYYNYVDKNGNPAKSSNPNRELKTTTSVRPKLKLVRASKTVTGPAKAPNTDYGGYNKPAKAIVGAAEPTKGVQLPKMSRKPSTDGGRRRLDARIARFIRESERIISMP